MSDQTEARVQAALASNPKAEKTSRRAQPAPPPQKPKERPTVSINDAELKRAIGFPINAAHDAWANILHDDYYRLSEEELNSIVEPAAQIVRQYGWEYYLLRYSAPISLVVAIGSIEADRIAYLMSDNGPDTEEEFLAQKPEIRRPNIGPLDHVPVNEETGEVNGATSPATNVGERGKVIRDGGSMAI